MYVHSYIMSRSLDGYIHLCVRIYKMYVIYSCCVAADTEAGVAAEVENVCVCGGGGGRGTHRCIRMEGIFVDPGKERHSA